MRRPLPDTGTRTPPSDNRSEEAWSLKTLFSPETTELGHVNDASLTTIVDAFLHARQIPLVFKIRTRPLDVTPAYPHRMSGSLGMAADH